MPPSITPRPEGMPWIQFLAGPVLWSIHFLISYLLVEAFCKMGWSFELLGIRGLTLLLIVITLLAVLGAIWFGFRSFRAWNTMNRDRTLWDELRDASRWSEGSHEFVLFSGFLLSVLFGATILMVGIPALFLRPCA